jgi:UDP-N-acetylglucosamine--N-acetylmuramyl-(pentapeptide) pyrophosphoryl-undecaprenol N-acetylglucosamine transferase
MTEGGGLAVVVAGGGTGGHLYPGIAVAREIMAYRADARVTFAGTARGIESRVVPREGFELDVIRSGGLKGKSLADRMRGIALLPVSALDAWRVLSRRTPRLVIGVGGYSSGPVVALAALRGIPTLLLEQNAVPGLTNRLLARVVRAAAVTYEQTLSYFGGKGFVAGNPVRAEFLRTDVDGTDRAPAPALRVLIFGGSQGAHAINVAAVEAAEKLAAAPGPLVVTHQTGERDVAMVREGYARAGLAARVEPFLYEMDREMKAAGLVVSRAGATTLAEITAAGKPAVLVPLPTATDDHQRKNAEVLARAGAAEVIDQRDLSGSRLAECVQALAADPERRRRMGEAARRLARPDAASVIARRALELAGA